MALFSLFKSRKKKTSRKTSRKKSGARKGSSRNFLLFLGVTLAVVIAGVGLLNWSKSNPGQAALLALGSEKMYGKVQLAVDLALVDVFPEFPAADDGLRAEDYDWPAPDFGPAAAVHCRLVGIDSQESFWNLQMRVEEAVTAAGARILWSERLFPSDLPRNQIVPNEAADYLRLDVGVSGKPTHTLVLHRKGAKGSVRWGGGSGQSLWSQLVQDGQGPVVALVIDDWGYNKKDPTRKLLSLKAPFTMAVLPDLSFSRHFALAKTDLVLPPGSLAQSGQASDVESSVGLRRAAGCLVNISLDRGRVTLPQKRREIILHLPMEPQGYPKTNPGEGAVLVGMDEAQIEQILNGAMESLPNVTGVNNHMGSAATSDRPTMQALMEVLRGRGLFFIDSLTTARSVAYEEAVRHNLPALKNRIFLDYDNESHEQVKANLGKLIRSAKATGFAVGIGHPHAATAEVLLQEIPKLQEEGVRFVTVSEMLALRELAQSRKDR